MSALSESSLQEGDLIAERYRVVRSVGSGGMGVIVEALHEALGQRVAIKILRRDLTARTELVERFVREARAAARLTSDHVVRVFDVGTHDGLPFMVMELLEGEDLSSELARRGRLPVHEVVEIGIQALHGIAEAHTLGVIHRDLKPSNLFRALRAGAAPRMKVLDFGISKLENDEMFAYDRSLTSTRSMLGSPAYMSPEQVRSSRGVDARTDVWSAGVILYELLTGQSAFDGETLGDLFAQIREDDLPSVRSKRPEVSPALDAVVMRCLQRDRTLRHANGGALREALLPFAAGDTAITGDPMTPLDAVRTVVEPPRSGSGTRERLIAEAETLADEEAGTRERRAPEGASSTLAAWSPPGAVDARRRRAIGAAAGVALVAAALWLGLRGPADATPAPGSPPSLNAPQGISSSRDSAPPSEARVPPSTDPRDPPAIVVTPTATATAPVVGPAGDASPTTGPTTGATASPSAPAAAKKAGPAGPASAGATSSPSAAVKPATTGARKPPKDDLGI
jgi:serine/threonine protein kinase